MNKITYYCKGITITALFIWYNLNSRSSLDASSFASLTLRPVVSDQMITAALLPGLRCLVRDMEQVAPDHAAIVASMIKELESGNNRDVNTHVERSVGNSCFQ